MKYKLTQLISIILITVSGAQPFSFAQGRNTTVLRPLAKADRGPDLRTGEEIASPTAMCWAYWRTHEVIIIDRDISRANDIGTALIDKHGFRPGRVHIYASQKSAVDAINVKLDNGESTDTALVINNRSVSVSMHPRPGRWGPRHLIRPHHLLHDCDIFNGYGDYMYTGGNVIQRLEEFAERKMKERSRRARESDENRLLAQELRRIKKLGATKGLTPSEIKTGLTVFVDAGLLKEDKLLSKGPGDRLVFKKTYKLTSEGQKISRQPLSAIAAYLERYQDNPGPVPRLDSDLSLSQI